MKLELTHKQTTGLVMTTEMRQAISMLQLSSAELWEQVKREVDENPILNIETPSFSPSSDRKGQAYQNPIDHIVQERKSWRDDLFEQAGWLRIDARLKKALVFLIGNLDDRGFCTVTEKEAAERISLSISEVKRARRLLLQFEPFGVGCYDFKEFLLIQTERDYPDSTVLTVLISNHLQDVAEQRFEAITQKLEVDLGEVMEAIEVLKSLQPRPLVTDPRTHAPPAMPDLILEKGKSGYLLRDPFSITKQIKWDTQLVRMYEQGKEAQDYLDQCYKKARWLLQCMEQRTNTIMKVAETIIQHQKDFLQGGSLKPLTLKNVAEALEVHESTVSRAVSNKVMQTPEGIVELKYFFITGFKTGHGAEYSSHQIKEWMQMMIDEEEPSRPFSDQKIASELKSRYHVVVSRRTVAKYRESLNLPSSSKRKALRKSVVDLSKVEHIQ